MRLQRGTDAIVMDGAGASFGGGSGPGLSAEMVAAARCAVLLEDAGLRIAFRRGARGRVGVELRRSSGGLLRPLTLSELFEVIALDAVELEAWVSREV